MTEPEQALEHARRQAAAMRKGGAYGESEAELGMRAEEGAGTKLYEWALIEPDLSEVRSTRAVGRPFTAFKRLLVRLLAQYNGQILAQQTRFNVTVASRLAALEARIEELERRGDR